VFDFCAIFYLSFAPNALYLHKLLLPEVLVADGVYDEKAAVLVGIEGLSWKVGF